MAEITFQSITDTSELTPITLEASDTFKLPTTGRAFLLIQGNAAKTLTLTGEGVPVEVPVTGYGKATFNAIELAVDDAKSYLMPLNPKAQLLQGTVTMTGGEALIAYLYTI